MAKSIRIVTKKEQVLLNNLLLNPSFEASTTYTNWTRPANTKFSLAVYNDTAFASGSKEGDRLLTGYISSANRDGSVQPLIYQKISTPVKQGHKYYCRCFSWTNGSLESANAFHPYIQLINAENQDVCLGTPITFIEQLKWTLISAYGTANSNSDYMTFYIQAQIPSATGGSSYLPIDDCLCADLTEIFGAGNEPTKEWCDSNYGNIEKDAELNRNPTKNMYIGVSNKARCVKKAYIGVDGVARKIYGAKKPPLLKK